MPPLEMVEVQVVDYLGEDDIERFDAVYGLFLDSSLLEMRGYERS